MHTTLQYLAAMATYTLFATMASAQTAKDIRGPSPLVAIETEAPATLIVDPPLPEPLALGRVFIQYRTENLRVVPVFGQGALDVSPRIGHIHITVDDAPWHFVDASGETVTVVALDPGPHKVLIELADPCGLARFAGARDIDPQTAKSSSVLPEDCAHALTPSPLEDRERLLEKSVDSLQELVYREGERG